MVKVATFTVATLTILMPAAVAYNCQKGLNYCGYNLLNRGRHFVPVTPVPVRDVPFYAEADGIHVSSRQLLQPDLPSPRDELPAN